MKTPVSHVQPDLDQDAVNAARGLLLGPCQFVAGAMRVEQLPSPSAPEVAFAGRSNVGKSSLINALTGRKALARTSITPGRTQQINFFSAGGRLTLVDLPGYGFARASKGRVRAWTRLIMLYLKGRAGLRRVMLLIDARRGIGTGDREVMDVLDDAAVSYQVVLTKSDKVESGTEEGLVQTAEAELAKRPAAYPHVLMTSARTGAGIEALRISVAMLAAPDQLG